MCMIKICMEGGGEGVLSEEGGSSERCLKWGSGGSLRDLSKNILKQGVDKGKSYSQGEGGFEGVTIPALRKILAIHNQILQTKREISCA